ncbi:MULTISPECIES: type II toxin-antitoxin system HicA family toxin [Nostocales]|jgi:mRNA interferase HicA|uniref:YcfA n=1 Tax=Aphanizomenon flos-aquae FACHB-1040 TaxID=2692887 RepID=A0ABR8C205_APHFL|nr:MULTISPECIES: hypothetical protein [Nostocales]MBD2281139.1 hypothetical protein [Aphanizomenon flos-aquae FACHB-1040]MBE9257655.1 hypothetical protein [Dolichospermum sp. LEGE 00246]MBO1063696.1 hypothetical protein [Anabaena sp. 54]MBO1071821.1 hypothetical protein [Dolichospermum sp. DEX189]
MSVKRKDLIKYLEENGFYLLREGGNHSIYTKAIGIEIARPSSLSRTN